MSATKVKDGPPIRITAMIPKAKDGQKQLEKNTTTSQNALKKVARLSKRRILVIALIQLWGK